MINSKLILCDVDECILHWAEGFTKFLKEHHDIIPNRIRDSHQIYKWLEINPDDANKLVVEFNSSDKFAMLKPVDLSQDVLGKLAEEGYRFVAITSCSSDGVIEKMRRENLFYYFGNIFEEVHCLDFDDDKGRILSMYPKSFWIEDSIDGAERGADIGHVTFLIDQEHNSGLKDPRIIRVKNWTDIYNLIHFWPGGVNSDINSVIPESLKIYIKNRK